MNECEAMIALTQTPGFGPVSIRKLLQHFRCPLRIWGSPEKEIAEILGSDRFLEKLRHADFDSARREYQKACRHHIRLFYYGGDGYPASLLSLYDPPPVLYVKGDLPGDDPTIAIVGTRCPSHYGRRQAYRLARGLVEQGITIVSGLARGIDLAAHQGALDGGGRTLAVLGSGLDCLYPPEHAKIAATIEEHGALISEYPLDAEPLPHHFPQRNRIISGLSSGVIVVEGGKKSGALITADCALEQGREVFAVPGEIDSASSEGPHWLIQQGAKLVSGLESVLEEVSPVPGAASISDISPEESVIWECLSYSPQPVEVLICKTSFTAPVVTRCLLNMEMKGMVKALPGSCYVRVV